MNKKYLFLLFFGFILTLSAHAKPIDAKTKHLIGAKELFQNKNAVLIKKIKARINALKKQRTKLKSLKKWSVGQEDTFTYKVAQFAKNIEKLKKNQVLSLTTDEIVKKLQKQLKYLNNARINKDARASWTKKDDSLYEQKAAVLIDRIIKLRRTKQ